GEVARQVASGRAVRRPRHHAAERPVVERLNDFDEITAGFTEEQAIAEAERCLSCGICAECYRCVTACKPDAIRHALDERYSEIEVGAVILATGFDPFDPRIKHELGYGRLPNVVTSLEFERIMSASGPTGGHVLRRSDGAPPRRIAFLQCVGSRDRQCGHEYCSSVCCMYAIKEAVIAREHDHAIQATIFFMDMRAYGKDFDKYYERARDEYGVRFVRSRVARVDGNPDGSLDLVYVTEDERHLHETFDMVVLSVGLEPSRGTRELIERLGLRPTDEGFVYTDEIDPLASSRSGIYVCGAAHSPRDIPETVMQAGAAAAEAGALLAPARHTLTQVKEYPPEIDVSGDPPRVGVFVCHCGINIAGTVDVEAVQEHVRTLPYVVYAGRNLFTCSQDTQGAIQEIIREHGINRVVVASCSPRTHEALFQETIREIGLNPHLFELANIRDQCSWVHQSRPQEATEKAKDLVRMAVARVTYHRALYGRPLPVTHSALVVGGGVSGMTAALRMADQGYEVHLVEREEVLGGNARHIHRTLRNERIQEALARIIHRTTTHPRIRVYTGSTLRAVEGYLGNYRSIIGRNKTGGNEVTVEHGVAIIATGGRERVGDDYFYGRDPRVLTQRQLEEALAGGGPSPAPRSVVMIQCVGSRTPENPYCSRVCCSQALKNAIEIKKRDPECDVHILYRDIRSYGLRETYYRQARDLGVLFTRYEAEAPPRVERRDGALEIRLHDPIVGQEVVLRPDLLALSVGIAPQEDAGDLAALFKVPLNAEGFFLEAHMKLRPVDFSTEGVYLAGLAHGPKFLDEAIVQTGAAVARAATILSRDELMAAGSVACTDPVCCVACGDCVAICPYGAIDMVHKEVTRRNRKDCAEVNPVLCKGCGACAAACRSGCITLDGFDDMQIMAQIAALMTE
ncbi:MAG TPA: FAD-dependent oxidoreductase, partial [Chloroflexi bacterium]|nr:FAD-dependent oxidoreductase [Chloroflexota bacterium]